MNNFPMKKILFFVDDYGGGAGNVVQILANKFQSLADITPVVAVLNPHSPKYKLSPTVEVIEYTMSQNKSKNKLLHLWRNISSVRSIVNEVSPDVIISFLDNINTNVCLSQLFNPKIKIIVSERSNPLAIKPYGLYRHLRPLAYARANKITVQCEYFKNFMPGFMHKMIVTPNPVIKPFQSKESYTLNKPARFVSCARLSKIKQFDKMIQAFKLIHDSHPDTQLTIYGEGLERQNLQDLISELHLDNAVCLPGASQDVFSNLVESDIYLMTSEQEGFPNALCEAMSVGLPVVAFECHPGLRDIIDDGANGFLVANGNIESMAEKSCVLLDDCRLREYVGNNAKLISEKFNVSKVLDIWLAQVESLCN